MRVLVVDDEPDLVESVRLGFALQWREVEVIEAAGGDAALDAVEHEAPDIVLLDNMSLEQMRAAVAICRGKALTEASGGVNLDTVRGIAETGVDYISVGALTHSARSVDVALDFAG